MCPAVRLAWLTVRLIWLAFSMPIKYFIYRSIMSDFFETEPMDIEGEAVCAVRPQVVTAEGEPGAGVERRPKTNETTSLSLEP